MSRGVFAAWNSQNKTLGLRALLYLLDHPGQATTCRGIASRLRVDPDGLRQCLQELVDCGAATEWRAEDGEVFYRLAGEPSLHALAARVRRHARDADTLSSALIPLLQICTQRAAVRQGAAICAHSSV